MLIHRWSQWIAVTPHMNHNNVSSIYHPVHPQEKKIDSFKYKQNTISIPSWFNSWYLLTVKIQWIWKRNSEKYSSLWPRYTPRTHLSNTLPADTYVCKAALVALMRFLSVIFSRINKALVSWPLTQNRHLSHNKYSSQIALKVFSK